MCITTERLVRDPGNKFGSVNRRETSEQPGFYMVRIRSGHELKPSSSSIPSQEMSDAKENDDVPVDASNNGLKSDNTEQEESFHSVESEAGHESSKSAENGETLVDEMDIEVTAADEGTVERQSASEEFGEVVKPDAKSLSDVKSEAQELPGKSDHGCEENAGPNVSTSDPESAELAIDVKNEACQVPRGKSSGAAGDTVTLRDSESVTPHAGSSVIKIESKGGEELKSKVNGKKITTPTSNGKENSKYMLLSDDSHMYDGNDSGTEEEQSDFIKELESFFKERSMEFKPLKFYGETVNCLKLYRAVTRLGGYDKVTSSKLWRQVGESFKPPRTCTTISFTFRGFYEKALLDYEKHKTHGGEISMPIPSQPKPISIENRASGSGRKRREAATRAMQGWHSKRLIGNGEVSDPIIKDKDANALPKHDKQLKTSGSHKRKKPPNVDPVVKDECTKQTKLQLDVDVSDLGTPADWVKVNVQKTKDCFEVYALVPGLLREEVRVQTDPAGRLVISGEPGHPDNPWGVTPFKKAVALPSRIDPHRTSAVVTLHGQLYVRVPFEKSE